MNANAIRVHGHVAGRALYDVADEMGMMIWQDVPLQWGYNNSAAFTENAVRQTREMIEQFGNSPPSSSGAGITNRRGTRRGWKNASRTGIKI